MITRLNCGRNLRQRGVSEVASKSGEKEAAMVNVDNVECIGCGACADLCPEVFELDERAGKARVATFDMSDRECIEEAIAICPVQCIYWEK